MFRKELGEENGLYSPTAQKLEKEMEDVVDVSSLPAGAWTVTLMEYPYQQVQTFKWMFRSLEALKEVVQGARTRTGPVWTEEDERYHMRELGRSGIKGEGQDGYMLSRDGETEGEGETVEDKSERDEVTGARDDFDGHGE